MGWSPQERLSQIQVRPSHDSLHTKQGTRATWINDTWVMCSMLEETVPASASHTNRWQDLAVASETAPPRSGPPPTSLWYALHWSTHQLSGTVTSRKTPSCLKRYSTEQQGTPATTSQTEHLVPYNLKDTGHLVSYDRWDTGHQVAYNLRGTGHLVHTVAEIRTSSTIQSLRHRTPGTIQSLRYRTPGTLQLLRYRMPGTVQLLR